MKIHALLVVSLLLVSESNAHAQSKDFQIVVSGELVKMLEARTTVHVSTIGTSQKYPYVSMSTHVENLPLTLPADHFRNRNVYVSFYSHSLKKRVFSVSLESDLFAKPRKINIKLDAPKPTIKVLNGIDDLKYTAKITQRMTYEHLPFWDAKRQKLVPLGEPPIAVLKNAAGDKLESKRLGEACMGAKWFANFEIDWDRHANESFTYSVEYDSGGLFPTTTAESEFTIPSVDD